MMTMGSRLQGSHTGATRAISWKSAYGPVASTTSGIGSFGSRSGKPVLEITMRLTAWGFSAARRMPMMPTPIVHDEIELGELECIEQQRPHPFDVAFDSVVLERRRLVGHTHADQVGGDHAVTGSRRWSDLATPDPRPGWIAVQEHNDALGIGVGVDEMHAQCLAIASRDLDISMLGWVAR